MEAQRGSGTIALGGDLSVVYYDRCAAAISPALVHGHVGFGSDFDARCRQALADQCAAWLTVQPIPGGPTYFVNLLPSPAGLLVRITEGTGEEDVYARLARCEALLRSVSLAVGELVADTDFDGALSRCLRTISCICDIDRLTICRCHPHPGTGKPAYSRRVQWSRETGAPVAMLGDESNLLWDPELTRWRQTFERGEPIASLVPELPAAERRYCEVEGLKSVLVMPIYADDEWWGTISFDDFTVAHRWSEPELDSIRALARSIGEFAARRRADGDDRHLAELHRTIVDYSKDVIFSFALGVGIVFASPSWRQALGREPSEVIGLRFEDLLHPEDVAKCHEFIAQLVSNPGHEGAVEYRIRHAEGTWRHHSTTGSVVLNSSGVPEVFIGIAKDVTERAVYEAKLWEMTEELKAANKALTAARDTAIDASKAKGQFLANMSHEIRTPLNGVIGMTSLLNEQPLDREAKEIVQAIQSSGETLLRVINDILDFSKIEAGKLDIEPTEVEIGVLISDVVALFQEHARSKGIGLVQLPPRSAPPVVLADSVRMRQVLSNLVANATKFTHEGQVAVTWEWKADAKVASFVFRVSDTGIGIPPDSIDDVFGEFTQLDSSTHRKYGGSGLGLAICKHLVSLMGGSIGVESSVGVGSTFTVRLSFDVAVGDRVGTGAGTEPAKVARSGLRVLLAEDNRVNVMVATLLLEKCGCKIDVAEDGLAAVSLALANEYDLILMDMQMPLCDGIEATKTIRAHEAAEGGSRVIIALTANAMEEDRKICMDAGMDGFLAKPISLNAVRDVLARFAGSGKEAA